jgi:hypothetical protein
MNYIKRLEIENEEKQNRIQELEDRIHQLKVYLDNDKFKGEGDLQGYVNIRDIFLRLQN